MPIFAPLCITFVFFPNSWLEIYCILPQKRNAGSTRRRGLCSPPTLISWTLNAQVGLPRWSVVESVRSAVGAVNSTFHWNIAARLLDYSPTSLIWTTLFCRKMSMNDNCELFSINSNNPVYRILSHICSKTFVSKSDSGVSGKLHWNKSVPDSFVLDNGSNKPSHTICLYVNTKFVVYMACQWVIL